MELLRDRMAKLIAVFKDNRARERAAVLPGLVELPPVELPPVPAEVLIAPAVEEELEGLEEALEDLQQPVRVFVGPILPPHHRYSGCNCVDCQRLRS